MTSARIRDAFVGDAPQIAGLITELGYPTTSEAMIERLTAILRNADYLTLVAETEGAVVGVAGATLGRYYEKDGVYARLLVLAVSSSARGLGTGGEFVRTVERWAAHRRAREVVVNSGLHRADAHRFYERRGYARTGYRFVKQLDAI